MGIRLEYDLKWKSHIDYVSKKLLSLIGVLNKLKHVLPLSALINIYNGLALSYLNYGCLMWGYKAINIFLLQKKLVRVLTNSHYISHSDPIFKELKTLKFEDLLFINELKFYHKYCNKSLPYYFHDFITMVNEVHNYNTRSSKNVAHVDLTHDFARDCLRYKIVKTVNECPTCIKDKVSTHSIHGISLYAKNYLLNGYQNSCSIKKCYVCFLQSP